MVSLRQSMAVGSQDVVNSFLAGRSDQEERIRVSLLLPSPPTIFRATEPEVTRTICNMVGTSTVQRPIFEIVSEESVKDWDANGKQST